MRRRAQVFSAAFVGLALSAAFQPCMGQSSFDASSWNHGGSSYYFHDFGPTAPRQFSYSEVWAGNLRQSGHGLVTPGEFRLTSYLNAYGQGNYQACGYYDRAWDGVSQSHDDFVFTCADNRATVEARMNLKIKGNAWVNHAYVTDGRWLAYTNLHVGMPGGDSVWAPHTWAGFCGGGTSTGIFAGIDADVLDDTFTGPSFTVPTNVPVSLGFSASVEPHAHSFDGGAYIEAGMSFDSPTGDRIGFPTDRHVFELPAGCTCNSVAANVQNNCWPAPCVTVGVADRSWGNVKVLYR